MPIAASILDAELGMLGCASCSGAVVIEGTVTRDFKNPRRQLGAAVAIGGKRSPYLGQRISGDLFSVSGRNAESLDVRRERACQQAEETVKGIGVARHGQAHEFRFIQNVEHLYMTSNVSALHPPERRIQRLHSAPDWRV